MKHHRARTIEAAGGAEQPVSFDVPNWQPPPRPPRTPMIGRYCSVEPLDVDRHGAALHAANDLDRSGRLWTYMSYGPFASEEEYLTWMRANCLGGDPFFHAVIDHQSGAAVGVASFVRIEPEPGCIEVGHLCFSPRLQRTAAATEAIYLMMQRAFDLGYRRLEWKCDALNTPSRAAALRFGMSFEGIFRQAVIYKGRNRDTAWYAIVDADWPAIDAAFRRWLEPGNFDSRGQQRLRLRDLTAAAADRAESEVK